MADVAYVLVVCAYNWKNLGYVNTSLTQLMMVDNAYNPVENIPFGGWNFKGLQFTTHPGQWYSAWCPLPILELISDPNVNNLGTLPYDETDSFPEWEWPNVDIKNISGLLNSIQKFAQLNL